MMFVFYWLTLAFGGVVTLLGIVLLVLGLASNQKRKSLVTLGVISVLVAWVPTAAFFALMYAMGARPAGDVGIEAKPPTNLSTVPGPQ